MTRLEQLQADALASRQYQESTGLTNIETHMLYARDYRRQAAQHRADGWEAMALACEKVAMVEEACAGMRDWEGIE